MADPGQVMRSAGRFVVALAVGGIGVFSIFWAMQFLVATGQAAISVETRFEYSGTVDLDPSIIYEPDIVVCWFGDYFDQPEEPVRPQYLGRQGVSSIVAVSPPVPEPLIVTVSEQLDVLSPGEGDFAPILKVMPDYPRRAQSRGLEGHCDLEFTVTAQGTTSDVRVIECTSPLFKSNSVQALLQFTYKPRVVDGTPIAVSGLRQRFTFEIKD